MSQEILFLLFMVFELAAILSLYQFVIIPRMAHAASIKTNNVFEQRMMDKTWNIPAMLEDYTGELIEQLDFLLFGYPDPQDPKKHIKGKIQIYFPQLIGGMMSAGNKQLRADPENVIGNVTADFLDSLDPPARMVANMVLPRLQEALSKSATSPEQVQVKYEPGLK